MGDFSGGEAIRGDLERALAQRAVILRPTGSAVAPFIRSGDMVRLEKRTPRRGSIALVDHQGDLWLHRLVTQQEGRWWVSGGPSRPEGWVDAENVLAIVTARRRTDGVHWHSVSTPAARVTGMAWSTVTRAIHGLLVRGSSNPSAELPPGVGGPDSQSSGVESSRLESSKGL